MLLDRSTNTGTTARSAPRQVVTVAQLLGRDGATTVRHPVPDRFVARGPAPAADRDRGGAWMNKATVATAVVTFGSVLAVGSAFLPRGHQTEDPNAATSHDVPITEALSAKPPSAAPVAKSTTAPGSTGPGLGAPAPPGLAKPPLAKPPTVNPPTSKPPLVQAPVKLQGRTQPPAAPSGTARHAAPPARAAKGAAPAARVTGPTKSAKSGKSGKSGAHRASSRRPATAAGGAATPNGVTTRASAPRGGVGGVVSGLTGGLL